MANKPLEQLEAFAIDVILERRYGWSAMLLRWFLHGLSLIYSRIMRLRWWLYDNRFIKWHTAGCMVISVGNLTVGGTGKTPVVEKFARVLTKHGRRVAILSRGYKSKPKPFWIRFFNRLTHHMENEPPRVVSDGVSLLLDSHQAGDEPFMLAENLRDVVVLVDKDRVKSANFAVEKMGIDTLLLDDGFQYLPLKERINVVLVDRQQPFGNRYILPRGTMREPKDHLKRADVIFITKCDGSDLTELKAEIRQYNLHAEIIECTHRPLYLQNVFTGEQEPLSYLIDKPIGAMCGIAVPESFEEGLEKLGARLIYSRHYADHHRFTQQEVINAINRTQARGGYALLTTEKDAVRFPKIDRRDLPVYYMRVEIKLMDDEASFEDIVLRVSGIKPYEEALAESGSKAQPSLVAE